MPAEVRPSLLVVDDDDDLRTLYAEALGGKGFDVWPAEDGRRAIEILAERTPSAVVLDMGMPHASGLAVLHEIRDNPKTKHLPVVVVTGVPIDDDLWGGRTYSWDHYFTKPIRINDVAAALRELIAERAES